MNKYVNPRAASPEERRQAYIRNSRETARIVKRTLLALALFAGLYYLFLLKTQNVDTSAPNEAPSIKIEESDAKSEGM